MTQLQIEQMRLKDSRSPSNVEVAELTSLKSATMGTKPTTAAVLLRQALLTKKGSLPTPVKSAFTRLPGTTSPASQPAVSSEELQRRKRFCIFLKVLSNYLSRTDKDKCKAVQQLVRHCTKMNRKGDDEKFSDLTGALQTRLRKLIGELLWVQCNILVDHYIRSRTNKTTTTTNNNNNTSA